MDDYIKQLEKRNEELEELLIMSETDNALCKWLLPKWREYVGRRGTEYEYTVVNINRGRGADVEIIARVYQTNGVNPDRIWCASIEAMDGLNRFVEFFSTDEIAKQEVEARVMKKLREVVRG
jgi:hypothetical protein